MKTIFIILFAMLMLLCLSPLFYLLVSTLSDLRYTAKRLKENQKDRDKLWEQYTKSYMEREI